MADLTKGDPTYLSAAVLNYIRPILGKDVSNDIDALQCVLSSGRVSFDPMRRIVEAWDVAVHAPPPEADVSCNVNGKHGSSDSASDIAFRIGRFRLVWESYLSASPCIDVHIEDIAIRVVFADLLLTRTNFDVLSEFGFPPALLIGNDAKKNVHDEGTSEHRDGDSLSSRVRVGSVRLGGTVTLTLESAALRGGESGKRLVEDLVLDLSVLRDLEDEIKNRSNYNQQTSGKTGVTTEELVRIIIRHFRDEVIKLVSLNLAELARGDDASGVVNGMAALRKTKAAFLAYLGEAAETVKEREIEAPITSVLRSWGLGDEQTKWLRDKASSVIVNSVASATAAAADKIEELVQKETTGESNFDTVLQVQQDLF